jgi:HNH endonuclease
MEVQSDLLFSWFRFVFDFGVGNRRVHPSKDFLAMKRIELSQGKFALVDDADYPSVSKFRWYASRTGRRVYAVRNLKKGESGSRLLHRFLIPSQIEIDHRDGDGLNCQRRNLRPATKQENQRGFRRKAAGASSRFRGVSWHRGENKWRATITINYKDIHLGYFQDEILAAKKYNQAARKFFGEFASPNCFK